MNEKFIYDVESSKLYSPDGAFLKKVYCPKAKHWNQLIVDDPQERSRGCEDCGDRVHNLESFDSRTSKLTYRDCVYIPVNSQRVIFINKEKEVPKPNLVGRNDEGLPIIRTVRNTKDINRAAAMGYWPDVRRIEYMDKSSTPRIPSGAKGRSNKKVALEIKFRVMQNPVTGVISVFGDYRSDYRQDFSEVKEVIPFTFYYPYYQSRPIAAYLIPPDLQDGSKVLIEDPIEDMLGSTWNQGDTQRAMNIIGYARDRKVIIHHDSIKTTHYIG